MSQTPYPAVDLPCILVSDMRQVMAPLADRFYDHPSGKLKVIGITGTKGKSSTAYYMKSILDRYQESQGRGETGVVSPSTPTTAWNALSPTSPPRSPWTCSATLPTPPRPVWST